MAKFQIGDILVNRNGIRAKVHDLNIFTKEYILEYLDVSAPNFSGLHTYATDDIDAHWNLDVPTLPKGQSLSFKISKNRVGRTLPDIDFDAVKKCTCGVHATYGKEIHISFHSGYCDLVRKTA